MTNEELDAEAVRLITAWAEAARYSQSRYDAGEPLANLKLDELMSRQRDFERFVTHIGNPPHEAFITRISQRPEMQPLIMSCYENRFERVVFEKAYQGQ